MTNEEGKLQEWAKRLLAGFLAHILKSPNSNRMPLGRRSCSKLSFRPLCSGNKQLTSTTATFAVAKRS